jgi:hypothetical protein
MVDTKVLDLDVVREYFLGGDFNNKDLLANKLIELRDVVEELDELKDAIVEPLSAMMEPGEAILNGKQERKVMLIKGGAKTMIDSKGLAYELFDKNRVEDFLDIAKVTKKDVNDNLFDATELLLKFTSVDGYRANSLQVKKLSKSDLELIASNE